MTTREVTHDVANGFTLYEKIKQDFQGVVSLIKIQHKNGDGCIIIAGSDKEDNPVVSIIQDKEPMFMTNADCFRVQ